MVNPSSAVERARIGPRRRSASWSAVAAVASLTLAPVVPGASAATPQETASPAAKKPEPFAFADFSWVPGNAGASDKPFSFGPFTG